MNPREVDLITVNREFGAGGGEFALRLGARLGWPVLDRDIVHRVADRLRFDDATVARFDEHPPSLIDRIAKALIIPLPDIYPLPTAPDLPTHEVIAAATTAVLEEAADTPPIIIVGHGSQCLFGLRPHTLHVHLMAPVADRIERIVAKMGADPNAAPELVRRADHDREAYVKRYFEADLHDPLLYDVQFNTHRVKIEDAVAMVASLLPSRDRPGTVEG